MTNEETLDVMEKQLIYQIEELHQAYQRAAKPLVDRLVEIRARRRPPTVVIAASDLTRIAQLCHTYCHTPIVTY